MALPPCFHLADRVFALVRHHAAHRLAATGRTQAEIGRALGVSQAMVSKYLKTAPGEPARETAWIVTQMAEELALGTAPGHAQPDGAANPWCRTFAVTLGAGHEDDQRLVAAIVGVLARIAALPLAPLVPAVGMNIVGAREDATRREEVAAFPGRLALVSGRLRAHAPPEFGASHHLAALLLTARQQVPTARYALNLAGSSETRAAARRAGEDIVDADGAHRDRDGVPRFAAPAPGFALHDPGGFGIEPAIYLVDADPVALAARTERLAGTAHEHRADVSA